MKNIDSAEQKRPLLIAEIEPIGKNRGIIPVSRDDLVKLVEFPLLEACQILFDKNILVTASSANKNNIPVKEIYIVLDSNSLSPANKEIAEKFGSREEAGEVINGQVITQELKIIALINENTTIDEVRKFFIDIANSFQRQEKTWGPRTYTIKDLKLAYGVKENDSEWNDPQWNSVGFWQKEGYRYNSTINRFFSS